MYRSRIFLLSEMKLVGSSEYLCGANEGRKQIQEKLTLSRVFSSCSDVFHQKLFFLIVRVRYFIF